MRGVVAFDPPYPANDFVLVPGANLLTGQAEVERSLGSLESRIYCSPRRAISRA
jgi:hypothetical protein